jgi:tRNA nucleotidyltransferase (CCA-adding enzyme)
MIDQLDNEILDFARAIQAASGRAVLVGGFVRDQLLARDSKGDDFKDYDFEVYGLPIDELENVLAQFGEVIAVGKSFGVLRIKGFDIDFSIPRRDNKVGRGHKGFRIEFDPDMTFENAARRRDLTVNSIGLDALTGEILDPFGGVDDLRNRVLRATDVGTFGEDTLRGLRVAQFHARLEMEPDDELRAICRDLDLDDLSGERIWEEFSKLFLKSRKPSMGFEFLRETDLLRFFPELKAMVGVPQDPIWHPEGTVWEHTMMVLDEAAALRNGDSDHDLVLLYAALCHDLGKPSTTFTDDEGRIRSPNHEPEGVEPTESFLRRIRAPNALVDKVSILVRYHLAPAHFHKDATAKAYRRLARNLGEVDVTLAILAELARADHFGRTTPDALAREFPAGDQFIAKSRELAVEEHSDPDVVMGRHLIDRGMKPGPEFGEVLQRCRDVQDETGADDPEKILDEVLGPRRT